MNLHKSSDFKDVILLTSQHLKIADVFVEKDYWVTLVLHRLANHSNFKKVVFKGGTSLSKAYQLIERFSEDVDLALTDIADLNGSQIKKLIDSTSKELTSSPFEDCSTDTRTSKGSRFRRTVHKYPRMDLKGEFHAASPELLLEINSFTDPQPIVLKKIRSFIGDFFAEKFPDKLRLFDLDSFEVQVLGLERTYIEKLLGLIRYSHKGASSIQEKVRHLYDMARLETCSEIKNLKADPSKFKSIVNIVRETDRNNSDFTGDWLDTPFASSPLFVDPVIKKALEEAYNSQRLQSLIWKPETAPNFKKAWIQLESLKELF